MTDTPHILVVDDDREIRTLLRDYLEKNGFRATAVADGQETRRALERGRFDLIVLDLMLPHESGLEICRELRTRSDVPVVMLTALGEEVDRVVGLEVGADDYLAKPFSPRELLARLRAILRRRAGRLPAGPPPLRFGRLELDRGAREVRLDGSEVALTSYQFDLLAALAAHAGRVLSRERLMDLVKGAELDAFDRSIDVHISRIRAAIEDDPKHPRRIITVRGAGYVFARSQDEAT